MRIEFYAPLKSPDHPAPSGDRRVARLFLEALRQGGHTVRVASVLRSHDKSGDTRRQARLRRLGEKMAGRCLRRYREDPPDIWFTYHLYHKAPDWLGPAVAGALGIPYVVAEASFAPKQAGGPWAEGHESVKQALSKASRVVCVNPQDAACVLPLLPDPDRLVSMAPFLDTAPPRAAAARRMETRGRMARRRGLDENMPWIAVAAMMRPGDKLKSYRVLGAALSLIRDRDWILLVAGDGEASAEVASVLDFGDRVQFLGRLEAVEIDALHAASDLCAWPAVNEAYGMALLEAQAAGLPVVAGDRPGVRQIVRHGQTGSIASAGDPAAFADAVAALLDEPAQRLEMSAAALEVTRTEHDIGAATKRLDRLLHDAVNDSAP